MILFQEAQVHGFWDKVRESNDYAFLRKQILAEHEKYRKKPIESLAYSEFKIFEQTGSRTEYEASFFSRRRRLNTYAALSLIYGTSEYIAMLEDIIWAICDEFTWALPAHLRGVETNRKPDYIELFAAETGFALSEILYLLGGKLAPEVESRAKYEVERRIINSFSKTSSFFWETVTYNWAAVCAAGVAACYIYLAPNRFEEVYERINATMECFLNGYNDDGACLEGVSYWNYGFGFFVYYARLLEEFKGSNLLCGKKVKNIAQFREKAQMNENVSISFADTSRNASSYHLGIVDFLHRKFNTSIPSREYAASLYDDNCYRWATFIRSIVWYDPSAETTKAFESNSYFKASEMFISRKDEFSFAAKCGHNDEPHNHNDVGGFIFANKNCQVICDIGMGEYTREYFGPNRYDFLVCSSRGHNVPIINGKCQKVGREYDGNVILATDNVFEIECHAAYGIDELTKLVRQFEVKDVGVLITSKYEFLSTPSSVVERMISFVPPVAKNGVVNIDDIFIRYSPKLMKCEIKSESYSDHFAQKQKVYFIDLMVLAPTKQFEVQYEISV